MKGALKERIGICKVWLQVLITGTFTLFFTGIVKYSTEVKFLTDINESIFFPSIWIMIICFIIFIIKIHQEMDEYLTRLENLELEDDILNK